MSLGISKIQILSLILMICMLCSCFRPPYNNFQRDRRAERITASGAVVGSAVGAVAAVP